MERVISDTLLRQILLLDTIEENDESLNELFPYHSNFNYIVTGPDRSGKTSLLFEYAIQAAENDMNVLFIVPRQIKSLPCFFKERKQPTMKTLKLIEIVYPDTLKEFLNLMSTMHLKTKQYGLVIVDDFDLFFTLNGCAFDINIVARATAFLFDAVAHLRKCGSESFLLCSIRCTQQTKHAILDILKNWFCNVISLHPHHTGKGFIIKVDSRAENDGGNINVKSMHLTFDDNRIQCSS